MSQPRFYGTPLIPPHFKNSGTLAVDTFIDIVGQNWFGIARLGTPLQQTAVQRGPLLRWPQLSRVAWARENVSVFQVINRRCPATLNKWRTIKSLVHKIRLNGRRGKGTTESFSRENQGVHRSRKVDEQSYVTFLVCDPCWYIQRT